MSFPSFCKNPRKKNGLPTAPKPWARAPYSQAHNQVPEPAHIYTQNYSLHHSLAPIFTSLSQTHNQLALTAHVSITIQFRTVACVTAVSLSFFPKVVGVLQINGTAAHPYSAVTPPPPDRGGQTQNLMFSKTTACKTTRFQRDQTKAH